MANESKKDFKDLPQNGQAQKGTKKQAFSYRFKKRAEKAFLLCSISEGPEFSFDVFFTFLQIDAIILYVDCSLSNRNYNIIGILLLIKSGAYFPCGVGAPCRWR